MLKAWAHGDDAWPSARSAVVAVGSAARPQLVQSWPSGSPRSAGCRCSARSPAADGSERPAGAATAPSGSGPCTTPSPSRRTWPPRWPTLGGPVLLVDDLVDSGWTMVLAGRALRRAGAPGVLPLALAVAG